MTRNDQTPLPVERRVRITKRVVDTASPAAERYIVWDAELKGFGLRVTPNGVKTYIARYRAGGGRTGALRQMTLGRHGAMTPDEARKAARLVLGAASQGADPARKKAADRRAGTVRELAVAFMEQHVSAKRKASTAEFYRDIVDRLIVPELGTLKAEKVTTADVTRVHIKLRETPYQANRVLAALGSMYSFGTRQGLVAKGTNPVEGVEKYREQSRERFLSPDELGRLGEAIREAETVGIPWDIDPDKPNSKHVPKKKSSTVIDTHAAAAIRLLLLTGCRLREILHLTWREIDFDRGLLLLSDSKTGKKAVVLNAPALALLETLPRLGTYVIAGASAGAKEEKPRTDLKRPWTAVSKRAGLEGVRLHDLRHTHASIGAGAGLGLPIIGKLLGHTQASTTQRYAHLDADPLRRASDQIGNQIAAALDGRTKETGSISKRRTSKIS